MNIQASIIAGFMRALDDPDTCGTRYVIECLENRGYAAAHAELLSALHDIAEKHENETFSLEDAMLEIEILCAE